RCLMPGTWRTWRLPSGSTKRSSRSVRHTDPLRSDPPERRGDFRRTHRIIGRGPVSGGAGFSLQRRYGRLKPAPPEKTPTANLLASGAIQVRRNPWTAYGRLWHAMRMAETSMAQMRLQPTDRTPQPIYVISDGTGLTAETVVSAAAGQFFGAIFDVHR